MAAESTSSRSGFVERRKNPRIFFEHFGTLTPREGHPGECYIVNLSRGGCMAYFSDSVHTGDAIIISFSAGDRTFSREAIVRSERNFTHLRRYILQIGKKLDFTTVLNIRFDEPLDTTDFGYISLNHIE